MQEKIAAIRCRRIQYGSRLLKMKKQLLDYKQLLPDRHFHGTEEIPIRKFVEMDWLLEDIQQTLSRFSQRELSLSVVSGWKSAQELFLSGFCGLPGKLVPFWFLGTIHNTAFMYPGELRADLTLYFLVWMRFPNWTGRAWRICRRGLMKHSATGSIVRLLWCYIQREMFFGGKIYGRT